MIQEPHPSGTDERGSGAPAPAPSPVAGEPAPRERPGGSDPPTAAPVQVAVKRTGGFAGLTKQWRAEPGADEASLWMSLISQCPWDAPDSLADGTAHGDGTARGESSDGRPPAGADRFTWWIQARCGETDEREAEVPDGALVGAWRELVDAVRDWSRHASD
ncbi:MULTISPECIES: protealysin inhibitor emfourin [Microbacterium]|uniref:protealysin inhibitor emfourin n=1 Tax=Microbacterium TaxID=33882 RepID=UPI001CB710DE|nr:MULTISPECIES: protealysin inhibitor emfourin [Microbacterium]